MKKLVLAFLAALMIVTMLMPVSAAETNTVRINPGDSIADALASIKTGGTLILSEGTYKISNTITLGNDYKNITIKGEGNVTITGGDEIPFSSFKACEDTAFLNALVDQSARSHIVSVNLYDLGITDLGSIKPHGYTTPKDTRKTVAESERSGYPATLTYKDKLLSIARYPNEGYCYIKDVVNHNSNTDTQYYDDHYKLDFKLITKEGADTNKNTTEYKNEKYADYRYTNWNSWGTDEYDRNGIWATAYYYVNWADTTLPVGKNTDGTLYGFTTQKLAGEERQRLFFFNVPEELDAPGEWYLNRNTGVLYLYPDANMKNGESLIFSPFNKTLLSISEKDLADKNITIENICFDGTCSSGISVTKSKNVVIDNCEFTGIGDYAVYFSGCYNSGVKNSHFHDLGSWGIYFSSCGARKTLTASNCFATNNHFERFSTFSRTYRPAVQMSGGVGTTVSHNEIHNAPHFAISYTGNNHIIEYNEIYNVCTDTADAGAIYTGRQWSTRGNEIRYNYFHDMAKNAEGDGIRAVYLDDLSSSTRVHGNVFSNVYQGALFAGGRYNEFTNNLLINCTGSLLSVQQRGIDWVEYKVGTDNKITDRRTFYNSLRNSLYPDTDKKQESYFELDAWKIAYPEQCATMLEDMPKTLADRENYDYVADTYSEVKLPKYNTVQSNILYNCTTTTFKFYALAEQYKGTKVMEQVYNATNDSSLFVNDYTLNKNSATYSAMIASNPNYEIIPFERIGRQPQNDSISGVEYSTINVMTSVGGTSSIAGYTLKNNSTDGEYNGNIPVSNSRNILLQKGETATLTLVPEEGKTAFVTYNDTSLLVKDNKVSFAPATGGTLYIQYVNADEVTPTSITAGKPIEDRNFETTTSNGTKLSSKHSFIVYAKFVLGTNDIHYNIGYKDAGYYVTKLDKSGNAVGETLKLSAKNVTISNTFAIRAIGAALKPGNYKIKPYLITTDDKEYTDTEQIVTIHEQPIIFKSISKENTTGADMTIYEILAFE